MASTNEPPKEVIDLLNAKETGAIGFQRPKVEHGTDEGLTYRSEHEALLAEGDFTRIDNGF